jgi:hypothetical protein
MHAISPSQILREHGLEGPDGRPLWAYPFAGDELARVIETLRGAGADRPGLGAAFCLGAAELWRRHYDGGIWSWHVVLDPLGWREEHAVLEKLVTEGMRYWRRELIRLAADKKSGTSLTPHLGRPRPLPPVTASAPAKHVCDWAIPLALG